MANFHVRSNSLPSKSHPLVNHVEDHLHRLKSSEEVSTSISAASVCAKLASLGDLHENINNLIQMPSTQLIKNELLEESLALVDLCGFARDILILTKESVQQLQSSIRRNGGETAAADDIKAYIASRKRITKMINKHIKNFKILENDCDLSGIERTVKEMGALDFSILKSVLMQIPEKSKKRSWSLFCKKDQDCSFDELCSLKRLKAFETSIEEVEQGLEAFFRSSAKTRVSLLNALNH